MEKIASFTIDHNKLLRGIYVSRTDRIGSETVTTFDIRMKEPNREPVLDVPALHTIEHLGATFLRNHKEYSDLIIYFGPMGCRTGCYLIIKGEVTSKQILPLVKEMFIFIKTYTGSVPGASAAECGNYLSQDLPMARWEAEKFVSEVLEHAGRKNLEYPET